MRYRDRTLVKPLGHTSVAAENRLAFVCRVDAVHTSASVAAIHGLSPGRPTAAEVCDHIPEWPESARVYLVDSDPDLSATLTTLAVRHGADLVTFGDTLAFLRHCGVSEPSCLVLDYDSRPEGAQHDLYRSGSCPVIYVSRHGGVPNVVAAMREGAVDFLRKPIDPDVLLRALGIALRRDAIQRVHHAALAALKQRHSRLTPRERQVLPLVIGGMRNKQAAAMLGISEVTLQVHRSQVMHKMAARSFADLIRIAIALGVTPTASHPTSWVLGDAACSPHSGTATNARRLSNRPKTSAVALTPSSTFET